MREPCRCEFGQFCPIYNKILTRRFWEYCQGISGLSKEKEDAYLKKFESGKFPNVVRQAISFGKALVGHALNGFKEVPTEQAEERLKVCQGCDRYVENEGAPRCSECGCFLKEKVKWASEKCPLGKWAAEGKGRCGCSDKN